MLTNKRLLFMAVIFSVLVAPGAAMFASGYPNGQPVLRTDDPRLVIVSWIGLGILVAFFCANFLVGVLLVSRKGRFAAPQYALLTGVFCLMGGLFIIAPIVALMAYNRDADAERNARRHSAGPTEQG